MSDTTHADAVGGYAAALLAVARAEGDVDGITDELFRVAGAFSGSDELRDTLYFVNEHHADTFRAEFKAIYDAMDTGRATGLDAAIESMRRNAPTTYRSLETLGVF